jgi:hypothetical protein
MNFLRKLFFNHDREMRKVLHDEIIEGRNRDIKDLQRVNKRVKLLLAEGHIEIIIKNVRGVIREDYGKKK